MIKKILFAIISLTILYFGYNSFNRLRYWDRSAQIFKLNSNQPFGRGGFDRGRGSFNPNTSRENTRGERTAMPDFGNMPDSLRQRFTERRRPVQSPSQMPERPQIPAQPQIPNQPEIASQQQMPAQPDSLRQQNRTEAPAFNRNTFGGRGGFEGGDLQRGGFQQRRNVRLNTVYRFLAVFAAFTVVTIYIDKIFKIRRRKKKLEMLNKSLL